MRHRNDDVPAGNPGQFGQAGSRVGQVFEHLEAEDEVEAAVLERQVEQVGLPDGRAGESPGGEPDRLRG